MKNKPIGMGINLVTNQVPFIGTAYLSSDDVVFIGEIFFVENIPQFNRVFYTDCRF
jgi:hypothetical protein